VYMWHTAPLPCRRGTSTGKLHSSMAPPTAPPQYGASIQPLQALYPNETRLQELLELQRRKMQHRAPPPGTYEVRLLAVAAMRTPPVQHVCLHMCLCACGCACVFLRVCLHVYICVCVRVYVFVCMRACVHVRVKICAAHSHRVAARCAHTPGLFVLALLGGAVLSEILSTAAHTELLQREERWGCCVHVHATAHLRHARTSMCAAHTCLVCRRSLPVVRTRGVCYLMPLLPRLAQAHLPPRRSTFRRPNHPSLDGPYFLSEDDDGHMAMSTRAKDIAALFRNPGDSGIGPGASGSAWAFALARPMFCRCGPSLRKAGASAVRLSFTGEPQRKMGRVPTGPPNW